MSAERCTQGHSARRVPCGACTACCQNDAVRLHPECGDDPGNYQTERWGSWTVLAHRPNGDCVYLGPRGCTIYERRPCACRTLDCADLLRMPPTKIGHLIFQGLLTVELLAAAQARVKRR